MTHVHNVLSTSSKQAGKTVAQEEQVWQLVKRLGNGSNVEQLIWQVIDSLVLASLASANCGTRMLDSLSLTFGMRYSVKVKNNRVV